MVAFVTHIQKASLHTYINVVRPALLNGKTSKFMFPPLPEQKRTTPGQPYLNVQHLLRVFSAHVNQQKSTNVDVDVTTIRNFVGTESFNTEDPAFRSAACTQLNHRCVCACVCALAIVCVYTLRVCILCA